uniref:myosin-11-like n=1 Tax=Semicossyphus pulcher TaxID=241346 RepID=UPI0037E73281
MQANNENLLVEVHDLLESKTSLYYQNSTISAELSQLKCVTEEIQAEKENLVAEVHDLRDENNRMKKSLQSKVGALECALEDVSAKESTLQELLNEKTEIEEQRRKMDSCIRNLEVDKLALSEEKKHMIAELAHLQSLNTSLKEAVHARECQLREAQEVNRDRNEVEKYLNYAESLIEKKQAEIERLRQELEDVSAKESTLQELVNEKTEIEEQRRKMDSCIRNLEVDKLALTEEKKHMIAELAHLESLNTSLKEAVHARECQLREAQEVNRDSNEAAKYLNDAVSLIEKKEAEIERLRQELHALQEKEEFLDKNNEGLANELARHESLTKGLKDDNGHLKLVVQQLQYQLEDSKQIISNNNELMAKHNREIGVKQEMIDELYDHMTDLKQSLCQLKEELQMRQEEEIFGGTDNFAEESRKAEHTEQLDSPQDLTGESLLETTTEEQRDEKATVSNLLSEVETFREEHKRYIRNLEEEKIAAHERNEQVTADLVRVESQREHLRQEVHTLKCQLSVAQKINKDSNEVMQNLKFAESLIEKKQAEIKTLRQELHALQEKEIILDMNNESLKNELAQLESLTKGLKDDIGHLKLVVQELQYQLEDSKQIISNNNELMAKQKSQIGDKQEIIDELYTHNSDLKQSIHHLKEQLETRQEEEILAGIDNLSEESRRAELTEQPESPPNQTGERLLETTTEEQRDEKATVSNLLSEVETFREEHERYIRNLEEEKIAAHERNEQVTADLVRVESQREHLRQEVHTLKCQLSVAQKINKDSNEVMQNLKFAESLIEKKQAEIKTLRQELHALQEKEIILDMNNESLKNELAQLESLTKGLKDDIGHLKLVVQELQYQLEDSKQIISNKNELMAKQKSEIGDKQEIIDELYTHNSDLKQSIHHLKEQLETRQEEEMLAGIANLPEESRRAELTEQPESPPNQTGERLLETTTEEQRDEKATVSNLLSEFEQLREDHERFTRNLEEKIAAQQQLETPAAEIQPQSMWRRCAKGLLKVGMYAGFVSASTLIPLGILYSNITVSSDPSCNPFDCSSGLLPPFCTMDNTGRPF